MLNPSIGKLINDTENRYKLVIDIAKRARDIAEKSENEEIEVVEKPVSLAIDQLAEEKGL